MQNLRLQLLFRTLFTVGLVALVIVDACVLQNNNEAATMTTKSDAKPIISHARRIQQEVEDGSRHGDLSYIAGKRKVPRGPDPIHNRRAGNSRRPPGRA